MNSYITADIAKILLLLTQFLIKIIPAAITIFQIPRNHGAANYKSPISLVNRRKAPNLRMVVKIHLPMKMNRLIKTVSLQDLNKEVSFKKYNSHSKLKHQISKINHILNFSTIHSNFLQKYI